MIGRSYREKLGLILTLLVLATAFLYMFFAYTVGIPLWRLHNGTGIVVSVLLGVFLWESRKLEQCAAQVKWLLICAGGFFGLTVLGQICGFQSFAYYLSGLNNNLRFFIFFFACILFIREQDRDWLMKIWDVLFWVNFFVTLYQFFVLGIKWDYLGGIFGTQTGCNAFTNAFFLVSITYSVLRYLNQQEKAWQCLCRCAAALIVTAMTELKLFVLEFVAILVLAVLFTRFSRRKLFLLLGGVVGAFVCVKLMCYIFPGWKNWFNLKNIWATATAASGYTGSGDWNRLTAVPIAWNEYLNSWPQKLFGLGLGNCDSSPVPGWTTPFYETHIATNYYLFSSGMIMLETGLLGMIVYIGFFLTVGLCAYLRMRKNEADAVYCQLAMVLSLMCLVLFIYNCSLRTEVGYLIYFAMALAFVGRKKKI